MGELPRLSPQMKRIAENWFRVDLPDDGDLPMPSGLIIGEQPGAARRGEGHFAMWPWPPSSAGGRLLEFSGMPVEEYVTRLARTNLFQTKVARWSLARAEGRAIFLVAQYKSQHNEERKWPRFVLCGRKVAHAFGMDQYPWFEKVYDEGVAYVVIPHPSGLNLMYNSPEVRAKAGAAVRWAARYKSKKKESK